MDKLSREILQKTMRFLSLKGYKVLSEFALPNKKRVDIIAINLKKEIIIVEVKSNKRNNGIASNLIDIALNEVKKENKILYRTTPKEDGVKYIFDKITNKVEELNIDCIPYNLTFIYKHLENNIFSKKDITENKDKMKILYEVANNMIKENNIEKIEDIKFYMTEEAEKSIENVFSRESNKATKRKKRKPA